MLNPVTLRVIVLLLFVGAGDCMGKISQIKKLENYYQIFEQIYEEPLMTVHDIAENTKLSRNTVAHYLKYMYEHQIMVGPHICMRPAVNYAEYVYLMNFEHPLEMFKGLKGFPNVLYNAVTIGDWNTMVVTDNQLDFAQLVGFQEMVYTKRKGLVHTPKPTCTTWGTCFKSVSTRIDQFAPLWAEYKGYISSALPWGENEWRLYQTFKWCMRKKVTPTLRGIGVRYELYTKWKKGLPDCCTVHTQFYPDGYWNYLHYCFLFDTDYKESVMELFSLFPTTPFAMEVGDQLLVFVALTGSDVIRNVFCSIYDMKVKEMVNKLRYAVVISACFP